MHSYTTHTLLLIGSTVAQSPPSLPACAESAVSTAIQAAGCSAADKLCICNSTKMVQSLSSTVPTACNEADQSSLKDYLVQICSDQGTASSSTVSPSTLPSTYARVNTGDVPSAPDAVDGAPVDPASTHQAPAQAAPAATESDTTVPADAYSTSSGDVAPAATVSPPSSGSDNASTVTPPQYPNRKGEKDATTGNTQATTPDSPASTSEVTSTGAVPDAQLPTNFSGSISAPSDSASVTSVVVSDISSVAASEESSSAQAELTTAEAVSSSTLTTPRAQPAVYPTAMPGSSGAEKRVEYSQVALAGLTVMMVAIVRWVSVQ
ncbi:hypothetical protein B0A48_13010 [Cryoendolithus antarcticus]|uniref:CFEM domain-containing protein n=1 Tax=Cryoendolithus antarcticus TaxID=1507870 RepID=A0A1V8SQK2_9PEZI|nr:hypothetical protein B0A48_13010 [Cryoendolithus antarcticus]